MSREIQRASLYLASGTIASRVLGFIRAIALAGVIGLVGSASADAFAVANQLPNTVYVIVAGGVLSAVLVPQIVRASSAADGGSAYINKLLTLSLVIIGSATVVATVAAPLLTYLYGTQLDPDTLALATAFAWWCLPQIFFYGLYTLLGEVLNARKSFGPFTWAPVLNNVIALLGLGAMVWFFGADPSGTRLPSEWSPAMVATLAGSATLGVLAQAVVLLWFWRRIGLQYRPDFSWRGVGLRSAGKMAGWTFGMLLVTTFAGLVETNVAGIASNTGSDASIAALGNAWLIFMLPHSVITVSIATAYFTRLSEHAAAGNHTLMRADLSAAARIITTIITLATVVLIVCAYPFGAVFAPGEGSSIVAMGNVVVGYLVGLVPFSLLFVVQRGFYALGDTRTPFLYTLIQVVLFTAGALFVATMAPQNIAVALAVLTSVVGIIQLVIAAVILHRRTGGLELHNIARTLARALLAALSASTAGVAVAFWLGAYSTTPVALGFALDSRVNAVVSMILIGAVMSAVYIVVLALVRAPELQELRRRFIRGSAPDHVSEK